MIIDELKLSVKYDVNRGIGYQNYIKRTLCVFDYTFTPDFISKQLKIFSKRS